MTEWQKEKAKRYFAAQGWRRMLDILRRKCEESGAGRPVGVLDVVNPTPEERDALDGFLETYTPPPEPLRIPIRRFERQLQAFGFAPSLVDLFEAIDGTPLRTRGRIRRESEEGWASMFRKVWERLDEQSVLVSEAAKEWFFALERRNVRGTRTLLRLFQEENERASHALERVMLAIGELERRNRESGNRAGGRPLLPLPVLAAHTAGDAHFLDWKEPSGRLFWYGLEHLLGRNRLGGNADEEMAVEEGEHAFSSRAMEIRLLYRQAGLADDDLSSVVLAGSPVFRGMWGDTVFTLRQVERLTADRVRGIGDVYAVENPSVFSCLLSAAQHKYPFVSSDDRLPVLVCVSGQPSVAVVQLLRRLLGDRGRKLFYAGDFDLKGIEIAESLARTWPDAFRPWHMYTGDYQDFAERGIEMREDEINRLSAVVCSWDATLPEAMRTFGKKVHQELLISRYVEDL